MSKPRSRRLSENDIRILRSLLDRYAGAYFLAGPDKDDLVERTFRVLADRSELFFEEPVEKVVAEMIKWLHDENHAENAAERKP